MTKVIIEEQHLEDIADAIRAKNGSQDTYKPGEMAAAILESGEKIEKDVNFYDYDGTLLYSYTKSEFLALESMPSNPSHTGLTSQGWNWSLSDAKTYVEEMGGLIIGQMYCTDDNSIRIYFKIINDWREPYVSIESSGTLTIDWGDGDVQTYTKKYYRDIYKQSHIYQDLGDYCIKITSTTQMKLIRNSDHIIFGGVRPSGGTAANSPYQDTLYKIELPSDIILSGGYSAGCFQLDGSCIRNLAITLPHGITNIPTYCFASANGFKALIIPDTVTRLESNSIEGSFSYSNNAIVSLPNSITSVGSYVLRNNGKALKKVYIPSSMSVLGNSFLQSDHLEKYYIPSSITSIESTSLGFNNIISHIDMSPNVNSIDFGAFQWSLKLMYVDFTRHTQVPVCTNGYSSGTYSSNLVCKVPDNLYEEWVTANNWSVQANRIRPYKDGVEMQRATITLAVDSSTDAVINVSTSIKTVVTHTYTLPNYSDLTTTSLEENLYFTDGTDDYQLGDTITVLGDQTFTLKDSSI